MSRHLLGIDLGGTNIKTGLCDASGSIVARDTRPTPADQGVQAIITAMHESAAAAAAQANMGLSDIAACGCGAPGPTNWQTGIVYSPPNIPGWKDVPLARELQALLEIPCYVENDANAACFGEFFAGAGADVDTMVHLTLGTGVGGGIVIDKRLIRGIDGTAGEVGHMQVMREGRAHPFGFTGNLEAYASVTGLVRTARKAIESGRRSILTDLCKGDLDCMTGKMISDAIGQHDEVAEWAMRETGIWLGLACATLINLLNPEKIVFSGGMIAAGDLLFDTIRETARRQTFEVPYRRCQIGPASLGEDAGVIGAAACALDRIENG